jgi:hypothetical protein
MPSEIRDADYWLDRGEDARRQSEQMVDPTAKREMKQVQAAYRRLARYAQKLTSPTKPRA